MHNLLLHSVFVCWTTNCFISTIFTISCYSGRTVVIRDLLHPYGLGLHGNLLYWTDRDENAINSINKLTGAREVYIDRKVPIIDLHIHSQSRWMQLTGVCVHVLCEVTVP